MSRKSIIPFSILIVVSFYIYAVLGITGIFFGKANAEEQISLLHKEWIFEHSVIDEHTPQNFTFDNPAGTTVFLQRFDNGQWVNIHKHEFDDDQTGTDTFFVNIKSPTETGIFKYRIIAGKYSSHTLYDFTVQNHDPSDYSDYIQEAYDSIKNYCGGVFITEGDTNEMNSRKTLGLANTGANKIQVREGMDSQSLQWVARHECGHILQHRAYDKHREIYPISEKRSILWLNDELSPYYDEKYENDRGTGYSEKNADCIAAYLDSDQTRFHAQCLGNQAQAAHNIVQGKPLSSLKIHSDSAETIRIEKTGFAVSEAQCIDGLIHQCFQKFEHGIVQWSTIDDKVSLKFIKNDGTVHEGNEFFRPSLADAMKDQFEDYNYFDELFELDSNNGE